MCQVHFFSQTSPILLDEIYSCCALATRQQNFMSTHKPQIYHEGFLAPDLSWITRFYPDGENRVTRSHLPKRTQPEGFIVSRKKSC